MAATNTCWGIEVGAGGIKALKLERSGDDINVLEFAVIPHKKVLSTPDLDQADATRVALGELVSRFDLTGSKISISVPGHSAFARFAKLPPVEPKKIPDIVKFEAVQQIPFPIEDVEWDYQTFTSPDSPDVEVGIFAITRDRVMERLATWGDLGITPDYITLGPIAAYNAVAWDLNFDPKTPGTVICDIGTTSTDLIVCEPGRVWVRTFPIGGHQFTEALVGAFKLSYQKAEALKKQAEQTKHARHVLQAMRPVFSDLAQDVQRSIGYYQTSHKDANLTRLIGLGSTFNLPGLRKYLSQQLQMEVVRLEQFNRISVEGPSSGEFQAATLNMATAYGLALQGLGFDFGIMANLMPVSVVREAMWKKKVKWFAVAAGLSVIAGGATFLRPFMNQAKINASPRTPVIGETASIISRNKAEWNEVSGKYAADYKAANVANLLTHREIYAHIVGDLGKVMKVAQDKAAASAPAAAATTPAKPVAAPEGLRFAQFDTAYSAGVPGADPMTGAAPEGAKPQQRIKCELEVTTAIDAPERFIADTIQKWVTDNAKRDGIPYDLEGFKFEVLDKTKIEAPKEELAAAGGSGSGSTGLNAKATGEEPIMSEEEMLRRGLIQTVGGGAPPPRNSTTGSRGGAGSEKGDENVERLAPLPEPETPGKPGQTLYRLKVRWDAVIKQPTAPAEGTT